MHSKGGSGDGVRATRVVLIDRGDVAAGYSGGVPYVFRDIADNVDDPKLILSDGFVPALNGVPEPGSVVVLSDAGAETLRSSGLDADGPRPSSSEEIADRGA